MMDHTIYNCCGNYRITEIVPKFFKIDIGGNDGRPFAISPFNNFKKQGRISCRLMFKSIKTNLINKEYFR